MKISLNRKLLARALTEVACAVPARTPMPILSSVRIAAVGNMLTVIGDSAWLRATAPCLCTVIEPGVICINHQKLIALISRDADIIELESLDDDKYLNIILGDLRAKLPTSPSAEFPAARNEVDTIAFAPLDPGPFSAAFSMACACAGDGVSHIWNEAVHLQHNGQRLAITAGDGKQFLRVLLPDDEASPFERLLPARQCKLISGAFHNTETAQITVYGGHVKFNTDMLQLDATPMSLTYGPVGKLAEDINLANNFNVTIDRLRLLTAVQSAAIILEAGDYGISLEITGDILSVRAHSSANAAFGELIPVAKSQPLLPVNLNHQPLLGFLKSLKSDKVIVHYCEEMRALRLTPQPTPTFSYYIALMHK